MSSATAVRERLKALVNRLASLMLEVPVSYRPPSTGMIVYVAPDYFWGNLTPEQQAAQLQLQREYDPLSELIELLLRGATDDLLRQLASADDDFRRWLEFRGSNWSLSQDVTKNESLMRAAAEKLERVLDVLQHTGGSDTLVIPDTNSLLAQPDPTRYRSIGGQSFRFILLPTVLAELDDLKISHRNEAVRDKAKALIRRISGWRGQGSLVSGVVVDKTIKVQAVAQEPDMGNSLSWLDPQTPDDRILASALEIQAANPATRLILVSDDINLLNKADLALVDCCGSP